MTVYEQARAFRKELLDGEMLAQRQMAAAYADSYQEVGKTVKDLTAKIKAQQDAGKRVPKTWLKEQGRLQSLTDGMARASASFAPKAEGIVNAQQRRTFAQGAKHAKALADLGRAGQGEFVREGSALHQAVGFLRDGSPVREALDRNGRLAGRRAAKVLRYGIATGQKAETIAKNLQAATGMPAVRAATIARTETMRAYNAASIETYRANADAFDGYIRIETLDSRTCALCWALHGTVYALDQDLDTHPNCRGTTIPKRIGKETTVEPGADRFARLDPAKQSDVLGPKTFALYQSGQIGLGAIVTRVNDPAWGPQIKRTPYETLASS